MADFCAQGFSISMGLPLLCGDMIHDVELADGFGVADLCETLGPVLVGNNSVAIAVQEDRTWDKWHREFTILCKLLDDGKYIDSEDILSKWYVDHIKNKFENETLKLILSQIYRVSWAIFDEDPIKFQNMIWMVK